MNFFHFMVQNRGQVLELTWEHLSLVGISILLAVLAGVPLGITIARWIVRRSRRRYHLPLETMVWHVLRRSVSRRPKLGGGLR